MLLKKLTLVFFTLLALSGCMSLAPVTDEAPPLQPGYGIYAIALDTVEDINSLFVSGKQNFVIKWPPVGKTLYLYQVPAGEYCIREAHIKNYVVTFRKGSNAKGFCTYVEADTINYSGHIFLRANSQFIQDYSHFVRLMARKYPKLCREFIGDACEK